MISLPLDNLRPQFTDYCTDCMLLWSFYNFFFVFCLFVCFLFSITDTGLGLLHWPAKLNYVPYYFMPYYDPFTVNCCVVSE